MYQQHTWSISKIVIAIALIISASVGYMTFVGPSHNVQAQSTDEETIAPTGEEREIIGKDLLVVLEKIESIKLDESIFTDPAFVSLQDYSITLVPETAGRINPFAPLPGSTKAR